MTDETEAHTEVTHEKTEPEMSPVPSLFYWSLFFPTLAVMAYGLQQLVKPKNYGPFPRIEDEPEDEGL